MPGNFRRSTFLGVLAGAVVVMGCSAPLDGESIAESREAANVCNETVPENRHVDGFPAYSQCDATNGSIWSNNGIDTATSSQGEGWVRTQQGGGYQCTEWAWRYMYFRWGVSYRYRDAKEWCDGDLPDNLVLSTTPVHGDLIVFDGGVCGADETTGHIAVVDTVDVAGGRVTFVEENRAGRRTSQQSCGLCYLHAVANDGTPGMAGAPGAGGAGGAAGRGGISGGAPGEAGTGGGGPMSAGAGGESTPASGGVPSTGGAPSTAGVPSGGAPGAAGGALSGTGGTPATAGSGMGGAGTTGAPAAGGASAQGAAPGSGGGTPTGPAGFGGQGMPPGAAGAPSGDPPGAETTELEGGMGCSVGPRSDRSSGALLLALALLGLGRRRRPRLAV